MQNNLELRKNLLRLFSGVYGGGRLLLNRPYILQNIHSVGLKCKNDCNIICRSATIMIFMPLKNWRKTVLNYIHLNVINMEHKCFYSP